MQNELVFTQYSLNIVQNPSDFSPFKIELVNNTNGNTIFQLLSVKVRTKENGWEKMTHYEIKEKKQDAIDLELFVNEINTFLMKINIQNQSVLVDLTPTRNNIEWVEIDLNTRDNEHFLGFGERFDSIDQRGKQITLWVEDGAHAGYTYIPVPFFISSNGYGLFIDTNEKCIAQIATPDEPNIVSIRNPASSLKFTIFVENSTKEILSAYTKICGRPDLPPQWVFGP